MGTSPRTRIPRALAARLTRAHCRKKRNCANFWNSISSASSRRARARAAGFLEASSASQLHHGAPPKRALAAEKKAQSGSHAASDAENAAKSSRKVLPARERKRSKEARRLPSFHGIARSNAACPSGKPGVPPSASEARRSSRTTSSGETSRTLPAKAEAQP